MKKLKFWVFFFLINLTFFWGSGYLLAQNIKENQPNVIIILVDDMGYHDVGFNGSKDIPTPNIDRIAKNGVKFTNGYVSYAVCGPSRAGLLTGRYQDRFGFGRNPLCAPNDPEMGLPVSEETLATALDKVGYQTMAIGKWHMGAHESLRPLKRGFDEFFGFLGGGHLYFPKDWVFNDFSEISSHGDMNKLKLLRNDTRIEEREYLTDALSREAVEFVERNQQKPFFLYLAYNAPHNPLQATQKYLSRFPDIQDKKRKTYAAMVSAVDDGVGQLLDKVETLGMAENTMIFFLSDNGGPEKANASDNGALRAGKGSLYEGGIHVPFAMQWPGKIQKGMIYDQPIISLDIFATAVKHANSTPKNPLDGVDLLPYLTNKKTGLPHLELYWRKFDYGSYAIRNGDFKMVNMTGRTEEFYNLANDIGESQAITDRCDTDNEDLQDAMKNWIMEMKAPVFLGLRHDEEYSKLHPDRFKLEKY